MESSYKELAKKLKRKASEGIEGEDREKFSLLFREFIERYPDSEIVPALSFLLEKINGPASPAELEKIAAHLALEKDDRAEKIVSHERRYVWVCNPKVASRSIIDWLTKADPSAELIKGRSLVSLLSEDARLEGYYKFAFVRDPYARAYSAYRNKISNPLGEKEKDLFVGRMYGLSSDMSFSAFVSWLNGPFGASEISDRHFLPQFEQFSSNGKVLVDHIARVEDMEKELATIAETIGVPSLDLPRLNTNVGYRADKKSFEASRDYYLSAYDDVTAAGVLKKYRLDFELLGYSTTLPNASSSSVFEKAGLA